MTKKHFIALADAIRDSNAAKNDAQYFYDGQISALADFCASQNPRFNRQRWLDYIAGTHGPNGGKLR